ncbi:MAG TPA: PfkB family carbohydrate kinase [Actinomycetota bacterium]|nr:PfkB family carbohydrate kinase [Actinomycetota bacterium]
MSDVPRSGTDVAVVGAPFFDLTFSGLPRLPAVGEELVAGALAIGPGGTGMQAIGAARLGLRATLVAPRPSDRAGELLRAAFEGEGVAWVGPRASAASTTAILSTSSGTAMATVVGDGEPSPNDVAGVGARAVAVSLGRIALAPPGARVYVTTGTLELDAGVRPGRDSLEDARALILNAAEARRATGHDDLDAATRRLAREVARVVVTDGPRGALTVEDGRVVRIPAPGMGTVDATGAGDLFVATYVWADLGGARVVDAIAWACLAAGLSVRSRTAFEGAVRATELLEEGATRGLTPPPDVTP